MRSLCLQRLGRRLVHAAALNRCLRSEQTTEPVTLPTPRELCVGTDRAHTGLRARSASSWSAEQAPEPPSPQTQVPMRLSQAPRSWGGNVAQAAGLLLCQALGWPDDAPPRASVLQESGRPSSTRTKGQRGAGAGGAGGGRPG